METKVAKYILSEIGNNHNKYWYITLNPDGSILTEWGRVGDSPQSKFIKSGGLALFNAKCREKEKKGYKPLSILGSATSVDISKSMVANKAVFEIKHSSPELTKLIRYLAEVNVHNIISSTTMTFDINTNLFSTPLGIVTSESIRKARFILDSIAQKVSINDFSFDSLADDYLMLIPQNIGRKRLDIVDLFGSPSLLKRQYEVLDSLEASFNSVIVSSNNNQEVAQPLFDVELSLASKSEFDRFTNFFYSTLNTSHVSRKLKPSKLYSIKISSMENDFKKDGDNIKELWHGSKASNLLSIFKHGFLIPPSTASFVTGRMFGNGVYFSDQSTKSLNYSYGYWDRKYEASCFMFICKVNLGKMYVPGARHPVSYPVPGYDSVFARANVSGVRNNEFIVYETSRINPIYLMEFSE